MKKYLYFLSIIFLCSCQGSKFETELTVYNKSGKTLDSIIVHDNVFDKEITYRNVAADSIVKIKIEESYSKVRRGERAVFSINVYEDGNHFGNSAGFIGFPTAYVEDSYEFYIFKDRVSLENDPHKIIPKKHKISEPVAVN